jgi:hypothetical protein
VTRKDYELIAAALKDAREDCIANHETTIVLGVDDAARRLSRALASDNSRFDGHRFLAACGVEV